MTIRGRQLGAWIGVVLVWTCCHATAFAAGSPTVKAYFDTNDAEVAHLEDDVRLFTNRKYPIRDLPKELNGLIFTLRPAVVQTRLKIDIPAGFTVYLILDSEKGVNGSLPGVADFNASLPKSGWTRLADAHFVGTRNRPGYLSIFKRKFDKAESVEMKTVGIGIIVAASKLVVKEGASSSESVIKETPDDTRGMPAHANKPPVTTPIARPQATIKSLFVITEKSGRMLGVASDLIATVKPGHSGEDTPVNFTSEAGPDMHLVLEDVLRSIRVRYPRWDGAERIELSFEDKYSPKDGGSIGAAIGTLMLSLLQGFEIDPKVAITGDVSADGRVHRIGGVAAKIRGAEASGCTLLVMPEENLPQLTDAAVYEGLDVISGIQVVGVPSLDGAVGVVRVDRDPKLTEAITLFKQVQSQIHASYATIRSKDVNDKLNIILADCPNHFSAQLLLLAAQNKLPQKLSPSASIYYTVITMQGLEPELYERGRSQDHFATPAAVQESLKELQKVHRLADPQILPLVDAVRQFVVALGQDASGRANPDQTERSRQGVVDALQRLQADRDLVEKMLRGGV